MTQNSIGSSIPIGVALGGSGATSLTAYSVLCGGTTSTSPFQAIASLGSAGDLLTSNGAGTLPTFQALTVGFLTVAYQVFTANGTYTPTANMKYCEVTCIGGGGAGGGIVGGASPELGSGGGAGEYAVGIFSAATIGVSQAVTIGAAGAGAAGTGGNGGTTSLGALITAIGGTGGGRISQTPPMAIVGGNGGTGGTGGSFRCNGDKGHTGWCDAVTTYMFGGRGASSKLGPGAETSLTIPSAGTNATVYGAGGSGAIAGAGGGGVNGGNGSAGIIIIKDYV